MKFSLKKYFPWLAGLALGLFVQASTAASILGNIKLDHFGYRTTDTKIAYFTANPGSSVGLYNATTNTLVYTTTTITSKGTDPTNPRISGDTLWWVDFSAFTTAGQYYLLSSTLNEQSYNFTISDSVYQAPMTATLKALYYQRCGTAKPAAYAGANWADASACHTSDAACGPAPGCTFPNSYGTLNLMGGWHDAGDYNKYIGQTPTGACNNWGGDSGEALWDLLTAYEWNPSLFTGLQSNIPESGNGNPDILNEAKWELDWYLKMQMTDHHVLSVVHQTVYTTGSPPSTDPTTRYYYPPNPAGEAQFVALMSHAARVMFGVPGLASYAVTLRTAAENTWNSFVSTATASDQRFWAAAEIFRMEEALSGPASIISAAQSIVDNYQTWNGFWLNEDLFQQNWGMLTYMQASGATVSVVNYMKGDWSNLIGDLFAQNDFYNSGMHSYDYFWGADEVKMNYGMDLVWASKLGATGTYTSAQCLQHAEDFLHYMNGSNPVNMTLMTNAAALGASHGIWRIYHSWFGNYGVTFSYNNFIGKPASVIDPLYPYYSGTDNFGISDSGPSSFGPPPGIVPDGPSHGYQAAGGLAQPPMLAGNVEPPYEKEYRDWDYVDSSGNQTVPWVVNETGLYYTASYMIMASAFVTSTGPTPTATPTRTSTASPTQTPSKTVTGTLTNSPTASPTNTLTNTITLTRTSTPTSSATFTATFSATSTASNTASRTATMTETATPTSTATFTSTNSATSTTTSTVTYTPTITFTPIDSPTGTLSPSLTFTPSSTFTITPTNTATTTATFSSTFTPTSTTTLTASITATPTPANSLTPSVTRTPTSTATSTSTLPNSATPTNSPTDSMTFTVTPSPTFSPTSSPTRVTIAVSTGPAPPSNSTQVSGSTLVAVMQFKLVNEGSDPVSITAIQLTASGTGNDQTGITNVAIYADNNGDGQVDAGDTLLGTGTYPSDNGTANIGVNGYLQGTLGSQVYLVVYNFNSSAPTGTYGISIPGPSGVDLVTGQPAAVYWNPVGSAIITIAEPTETPTTTPTTSATATPTASATSTPTVTGTVFLASGGSPTPTPIVGSAALLYPNPSDGNPIQVLPPAYLGQSGIKVQIFTTAFRKVQEKSYPPQVYGPVTVILNDNWGKPLASGLYYTVIQTNQGRFIGKLLILR